MQQSIEIDLFGGNMDATGFGAIVASIAVFSPIIAAAISGMSVGYGAVGIWLGAVSKSLTKSNQKNNCGTVLDINLVGWYSTWNQIDN